MTPPKPVPESGDAALARWFRRSGIIAHLPATMPRHLLVEVIDGLLAAPVSATVVPCNSVHALSAIAALCERAGQHMLVGASDVRTVAAAQAAVAAGASWLLAPHYDRQVAKAGQALGARYIPGVLSIAEARDAASAGCTLLCQMDADLFGPEHVRALVGALPGCEVIVAGEQVGDEAADYAAAGAAALLVDITAPSAATWRQADLITDIRSWLSAWNAVSA